MKTQEKAQHTLTPWEVGTYQTTEWFRQLEAHVAIMKLNGDLLATTGPANDPKSMADAAFIVRAVNSHEALVKAVNKLINEVGEGSLVGKHINPTTWEMLTEAIAQAEQA